MIRKPLVLAWVAAGLVLVSSVCGAVLPSARAGHPAQIADEIRPVCITITGMPCVSNGGQAWVVDGNRRVVFNGTNSKSYIGSLYGESVREILGLNYGNIKAVLQYRRELIIVAQTIFDGSTGLFLYDLDAGGAARLLSIGAAQVLVVEPAGQYVYFTDFDDDSLLRVRLDGSAPPEAIGRLTGLDTVRATVLGPDRLLLKTVSQVLVMSDLAASVPGVTPYAASGSPVWVAEATPDGQRLVWTQRGVLYTRSLTDLAAPSVRLSPPGADPVISVQVANSLVLYETRANSMANSVYHVVPISGPALQSRPIRVNGNTNLSRMPTLSPNGSRILAPAPAAQIDLYVIDPAAPEGGLRVAQDVPLVTYVSIGFLGEDAFLYETGPAIVRVALNTAPAGVVTVVAQQSTWPQPRYYLPLGSAGVAGIESGELYEVRNTDVARRLVTGAFVPSVTHLQAVSADQRLLVFMAGTGQVYVWDRSGGLPPTPDATGTVRPTQPPTGIPPTLSPTSTPLPVITPISGGQESASGFFVINNGQSVLYLAKPSDSSPSGTLKRYDVDGREQTLASDVGFWRASLDGQRLLLAVVTQTAPIRFALRVLDLATGGTTPVDLGVTVDSVYVYFSADGTQVVYLRDGGLWRVPADASAGPMVLAASPIATQFGGFPLVRGNGQHLVYLADRTADGRLNAWLVPMTGPALAAVDLGEAVGSGQLLDQVVFSPDGQYVVYQQAGAQPGSFQLTSRRLMTTGIGAERVIAGPYTSLSPTINFMPDGRSMIVAGATSDDPIARAYVVPLDGSGPGQLVNPPSVLDVSISQGVYNAPTDSFVLADEGRSLYQVWLGQTSPARFLAAIGDAVWSTAGDQLVFARLSPIPAFGDPQGQLWRQSLQPGSGPAQVVSKADCRIGTTAITFSLPPTQDRLGYICQTTDTPQALWWLPIGSAPDQAINLAAGLSVGQVLGSSALGVQYSPDGDRAFFVGYQTVPYRGVLYTTRAGARPTATATPPATPPVTEPKLFLPSIRR